MGDTDERAHLAAWLCSPAAAPVLEDAAESLAAHPRDPLRAASRLRAARPDLSPDQTAGSLEQATLRTLARQRYGAPPHLLLTRDGLEAATRPEVAARRARLLVGAGAARVLDLTGGLGFDAGAFAAAGLAVTAVERDPVTAAFLAHNQPGIAVVNADATDPDVLATLLASLGPADVVFVDPARRDPAGPRDRDTARARPERDPERWSPPWSLVAALAHGRVAAKVAPGFTPPAGWQAEWVSVDRTLVECAVYSWHVLGADRQAVLLAGETATVVPGGDGSAPVAERLGAWVHEVDPAVLRCGGLGALSSAEGLARVDEASTWLTGDHASGSPALRSYLVTGDLVGSPRQQRRILADLGVDRCTVKSRDVSIEPRDLLRSLGVTEGPQAVIVLTRRHGRVISLLAEPAGARSA